MAGRNPVYFIRGIRLVTVYIDARYSTLWFLGRDWATNPQIKALKEEASKTLIEEAIIVYRRINGTKDAQGNVRNLGRSGDDFMEAVSMEELMAQEAQGQDSQGSGVGQEEPMTDAEIASMVIEEHKVRACMRGIFYCSVYCVHSTYLAHSI